MVIYRHSMVLLSSCVNIIIMVNNIEWQKITVLKCFITLAQGGKHKYCCNLPEYFNPRKSKVKITMGIYRGIVLQHWLQVSIS
jgi:hypothetical protein